MLARYYFSFSCKVLDDLDWDSEFCIGERTSNYFIVLKFPPGELISAS